MIIRDVYYNITSVHYSVHFKNENSPMKRIRLEFFYFSCTNVLIIEKSYYKYGHNIREYYVIKRFKNEN